MKVVNVLRDDTGQLAGAIERCERAVTAAGLCGAERLLHGETPLPGFVARFLAGDELVVHDRPVLGPNPAGRTEIRECRIRSRCRRR